VGRSLDMNCDQHADECDVLDKKKTIADRNRTREVQLP